VWKPASAPVTWCLCHYNAVSVFMCGRPGRVGTPMCTTSSECGNLHRSSNMGSVPLQCSVVFTCGRPGRVGTQARQAFQCAQHGLSVGTCIAPVTWGNAVSCSCAGVLDAWEHQCAQHRLSVGTCIAPVTWGLCHYNAVSCSHAGVLDAWELRQGKHSNVHNIVRVWEPASLQ
jgi:hypothetical protein